MSAHSLLDWAVSTGLAITLLVGFILIIRRPFARHFGAKAAYALWALPALRLFMPSFDVPILKPNIPEMTTSLTYRGVDLVPLVKGAANPAISSPEIGPVVSAPVINLGLVMVSIWLGGAVVWLAWQLYQQHKYAAHIRAYSSKVNAESYRKFAQKLGLKQMPQIRLAQDNTGPLVMGLWAPVIILPANFETHFSHEQQELTLLHEMAHICRLDLWAASAALLFRAVNWPNPVIHYAAKSFRADQEAACDASVLKLSKTTAAIYAETLMQAARSAAQPGRIAPLGLTIYHPLKERLMMMKTQNRRASLLSRAAAVSLVAGAFALTAPVTLADNHSETELAGKAETTTTSRTTSKQVIKSIEDVDGVKVKKHYEITTQDGVTTAYEIDPSGKKTVVDVKTIKANHPVPVPPHPHGTRNVEVIVKGDGDTKHAVKRVKVISNGEVTELENVIGLEGLEGDEVLRALDMEDLEGAHANVIVKRFKDGQNGDDVQVYSYSTSEDVRVHMDGEAGQGDHAKVMVDAASGLLDEVKTDEMSNKTRRKLEKARKALKDAQDAIAAEK